MAGGDVENLVALTGESILDYSRIGPPYSADFGEYMQVCDSIAATRAATTGSDNQVTIAFLESSDFNAFCANYDGDIIGINAGVLIRLRDFFETVGYIMGLTFEFKVQSQISLIVRLMYSSALSWVFNHELGHIWNGHLEFGSSRGVKLFSELHMAGSSNLSGLDLQTLEMDADGYATANLTSNLFAFSEWNGLKKDHVAFKIKGHSYNPDEALVILSAICIFCVFTCFDEDSEAGEEIDLINRDHPPAALRLIMNLNVLATALAERHMLDRQRADQLVAAGAGIANMLVCQALDRDPRPPQTWVSDNEKAHQLANQLLRHWRDVRPELELSKRGGNLPPVQEWVISETR